MSKPNNLEQNKLIQDFIKANDPYEFYKKRSSDKNEQKKIYKYYTYLKSSNKASNKEKYEKYLVELAVPILIEKVNSKKSIEDKIIEYGKLTNSFEEKGPEKEKQLKKMILLGTGLMELLNPVYEYEEGSGEKIFRNYHKGRGIIYLADEWKIALEEVSNQYIEGSESVNVLLQLPNRTTYFNTFYYNTVRSNVILPRKAIENKIKRALNIDCNTQVIDDTIIFYTQYSPIASGFRDATSIGGLNSRLYKSMVSIRGDGPCYYRTIIFGLLYSIFSYKPSNKGSGVLSFFSMSKPKQKDDDYKKRCIDKLLAVFYENREDNVFGDFNDHTNSVLSFLRDLNGFRNYAEFLHRYMMIDTSIIICVKHIVSNYLYNNRIEVFNAIIGNNNNSRKKYLENKIMNFEEYAQDIIDLGILPFCLGCRGQSIIFRNGKTIKSSNPTYFGNEATHFLPLVSMIYNGDHYDALIPIQSAFKYVENKDALSVLSNFQSNLGLFGESASSSAKNLNRAMRGEDIFKKAYDEFKKSKNKNKFSSEVTNKITRGIDGMGFLDREESIKRFGLPREVVSEKYISTEKSNGTTKYYIYDSIYKYLWFYREERYKNEFGYLLKQFENKDMFIINARGNGYCFYNCLYIYLCVINHKNKEEYKEPIEVVQKYCTLYEEDARSKGISEKIIMSELEKMRDPSIPSIEYLMSTCIVELGIKMRIIDFPQINTQFPDVFDLSYNDEKYNNCLTLIQNSGHFFIVLPYIKTTEEMCSLTERVPYAFGEINYFKSFLNIMRRQPDKNTALSVVTKQTQLSGNERKSLADALKKRGFAFNQTELKSIQNYVNGNKKIKPKPPPPPPKKLTEKQASNAYNIKYSEALQSSKNFGIMNDLGLKEKISIINELNTTPEIKIDLTWEKLGKDFNLSTARNMLKKVNERSRDFYMEMLNNKIKSQLLKK